MILGTKYRDIILYTNEIRGEVELEQSYCMWFEATEGQFTLNCYEFRMATIISFISTETLILKYTKNLNGN